VAGRAMIIANLVATLLALLCMTVITLNGGFLVPGWAEPTFVNRLLLGVALVAIPLLLIWCPALLGEAPPAWVSKQTPWIEVYALGWFFLFAVCFGAGIVLWQTWAA